MVAVDAMDDTAAMEIAKSYLMKSSNYLAVDVIVGDREVGRVER
jgi:hypothetical protein